MENPKACLLIGGFVASVVLNLVLISYLLPPHKDGREASPSSHVRAEEEMTCAEPATPQVSPGLSNDSLVRLEFGDPTMFEPFWRRIGQRGDTVIRAWEKSSYFSDASKLCWFMEMELEKEIRRLHKLVGNAVVDGRHIIVGTGSSQLILAALYALSASDAPRPRSVVSSVPYYPSYPAMTDLLQSGLFRWAGDAGAFKGDDYIEIVCSPNNPDGFVKEAVLSSEAGKTIHDHAYYWPQYVPITSTEDHEIMLFTLSKATGHAGTRLGWAVVKDMDVAKKMVEFIMLNTIGVSKVSQLRAAKILKVISDGYELPESSEMDKFFDFGRRLMSNRWKRLREVVSASEIFSLPEFPSNICRFTGERRGTYPAFAWLKCEEGIGDCETFLKSHKILVRSGTHSGAEPSFVRVSMMDQEEMFNLFIERLSSIG